LWICLAIYKSIQKNRRSEAKGKRRKSEWKYYLFYILGKCLFCNGNDDSKHRGYHRYNQ
jgi:hypothetical protein